MTYENLVMAKTPEQCEFWDKFRPVNRVAATDTYKRTMAASSDLFAMNHACYNLAARRKFKEEEAKGRYIMAGLEKMLYPWFAKPFSQREVESARDFFENHSAVKKFARKAWEQVLDNDGYLPVDIYAMPGGQTFLVKDGKHVPMMSVEGVGAIVSHLEPHLTTIYAPLIQATKARIYSEIVEDRFAEFGLRSDKSSLEHVTLMGALYVGSGGRFTKTSDDQSEFIFREFFKAIGTVGHEFIMAYQRKGISLEASQEEAYRAFIEANDIAALLPDTIDTYASGLPMIKRLMDEYAGSGKLIMPRFDSGDVVQQGVDWIEKFLVGTEHTRKHVIEDGRNPKKAQATKDAYLSREIDHELGIDGSGGYFQDGTTRDDASVAFKRSATMHDGKIENSIKFSNSPGKESIPGQVRPYARDNVIVVAQAYEVIDGEPLFQKVVDNGRIAYNEDWHAQAKRADETWDKFERIEYSPETQRIIDERTAERDELVQRLIGNFSEYQR